MVAHKERDTYSVGPCKDPHVNEYGEDTHKYPDI